MRRKFKVENMMCASCVSHVKQAAEKVEGVTEVEVNLLTETMTVNYNERLTDDQKIMNVVSQEGYGCKLYRREVKIDNMVDLRKMKTRIIVSFIFMILLMYISMGSMFGLWLPFSLDKVENSLYFGILQILLLLPIVVLNRFYFINGFKKLITLKPNMDSLIAIGALASILYGIFATSMIGIYLRQANMDRVSYYRHDLYFESAGTILTLITIGKFLESRSKKKTTESLEKIMALTPKTAILEKDGVEVEISQEEIQVGDILVIKTGMAVPVDGVIFYGSGSLNESIITGESIPIDKTEGDKVIAGSTNLSGYFKMCAQSISGETTIDQILDLVEEAASSKAPISRLADQISAIFVPIVIGIAVVAGIGWSIFGNYEMALNTFISVLVISCPCALGLATPVAIMVATGKAAENGILIKSAESLELCHKIKALLLDKTGTITKGEMVVCEIQTSLDKETFLKEMYTIEVLSTHPLSKAMIRYCEENHVTSGVADELEVIPGKGLKVIKDDVEYFAGNEELMHEIGIEIKNDKETSRQLAQKGQTVIYFAKNRVYIGFVSLQDEIRETSKLAIQNLKNQNVAVAMVTGDNNITASAIAKEVRIDEVFAKTTPEKKAKVIVDLQKEKKIVAFVGDGINDAVALTTSDVGIAIGAGSDVAIASADIILPSNDLMEVVTLISLSKKTIQNIKMNLFWAFFYNSIGILIATGLLYPILNLKLNPMIAALAMSLSSFCVVINALRLRFFKINKERK